MILTPGQQADIARLREQYGITQEAVARQTRGRASTRQNKAAVDRSLVSKVWGGRASSSHVLRATCKVLLAAGWRPKTPPDWLPAGVRVGPRKPLVAAAG